VKRGTCGREKKKKKNKESVDLFSHSPTVRGREEKKIGKVETFQKKRKGDRSRRPPASLLHIDAPSEEMGEENLEKKEGKETTFLLLTFIPPIPLRHQTGKGKRRKGKGPEEEKGEPATLCLFSCSAYYWELGKKKKNSGEKKKEGKGLCPHRLRYPSCPAERWEGGKGEGDERKKKKKKKTQKTRGKKKKPVVFLFAIIAWAGGQRGGGKGGKGAGGKREGKKRAMRLRSFSPKEKKGEKKKEGGRGDSYFFPISPGTPRGKRKGKEGRRGGGERKKKEEGMTLADRVRYQEKRREKKQERKGKESTRSRRVLLAYCSVPCRRGEGEKRKGKKKKKLRKKKKGKAWTLAILSQLTDGRGQRRKRITKKVEEKRKGSSSRLPFIAEDEKKRRGGRKGKRKGGGGTPRSTSSSRFSSFAPRAKGMGRRGEKKRFQEKKRKRVPRLFPRPILCPQGKEKKGKKKGKKEVREKKKRKG